MIQETQADLEQADHNVQDFADEMELTSKKCYKLDCPGLLAIFWRHEGQFVEKCTTCGEETDN